MRKQSKERKPVSLAQKTLFEFYDQQQYNRVPSDLLELNIDPQVKLVLILMMSDIEMNGYVSWKHQTYADKLGVSRQTVFRIFKKLEDAQVLVPFKENISGGKRNKYYFQFKNIRPNLTLKPKKKPKKKDDTCNTDDTGQGISHGAIPNEKPVTPMKQTCNTDDTLPVTPMKQTCNTDDTYIDTYTYPIDMYIGEEEKSSFKDDSLQGEEKPKITEEDIHSWIDGLDLDDELKFELKHGTIDENETNNIFNI